jgi:anti-sigma factor RsiW
MILTKAKKMKKTCTLYRPEQFSRFVDHELAESIRDEMTRHLVSCPDCRGLVDRYIAMDREINRLAEQEILKFDPDQVKQRLGSALENSRLKPRTSVLTFFHKNIYLKLASIAAILMISLIPFQGALFDSSGPSAIVKSVDSDFASIMIFETQKEKHTIIWLSET